MPVLSGPGAGSDAASAAHDAAAVEGRRRAVAHAKTILDVQGATEKINNSTQHLPTIMFLNGAVLNAQLGVDTYDTAKAYIVDNDGIRESTLEDER